VTRYGYLGVDLFFIISGFVVLLTAWDRRPLDFVVSRVTRLYPAYWFAVTATAVVLATLGSGKYQVSLLQYLANLTMLQSLPNVPHLDTVYWTLWCELRFYLVLFALACIGLNRRRVVGLLYVWLAATVVLELGVLPHSLVQVADLLVQSKFSHYFILGMALCLVYRYGPSWTISVAISLASCNAVYRAVATAKEKSEFFHAGINGSVVACIVISEVLLVGLIAVGATRPLVRPWFTIAGTLTYPLYLIHANIGFIIFDILGGAVNRFLLVAGTIVAMLAMARLIHTQVEVKTAPRLKRFLTRAIATGTAKVTMSGPGQYKGQRRRDTA
jgi:peptidoglycan/LPS O-acetylase OafA/YrhL